MVGKVGHDVSGSFGSLHWPGETGSAGFYASELDGGKVDRYFTGIFKIDSRAVVNHGLNLPKTPFRFVGMANELTGKKVFGHDARWVSLKPMPHGTEQLNGRLVTMANDVDQRIAELLCSRICHELVAGVAAINNGVELITEIDRSMLDEALDLIGTSARQSSARLQFYRMAYGFAGNDALKSIAEVRDLVDRLIAGEARISAELRDAGSVAALAPGWGKLLLNMFVFAADCLPRGGKVTYGLDEGPRLVAVATGEGARLPSRYEGFPEPGLPREDITALNIQAFYTNFLANTVGSGLTLEADDGVIRLGAFVTG